MLFAISWCAESDEPSKLLEWVECRSRLRRAFYCLKPNAEPFVPPGLYQVFRDDSENYDTHRMFPLADGEGRKHVYL